MEYSETSLQQYYAPKEKKQIKQRENYSYRESYNSINQQK